MLGSVKGMLDDGHKVVLMTRGNSMLPFIVGDRDSVELEKRPSYSCGDIVLAYTSDGRWVLHRVDSKLDGGFVLRGDGNLRGTERCQDVDVAGAVCRIITPRKEIDCSADGFAKRSRFWKKQPYAVRRVILGIIRRII